MNKKQRCIVYSGTCIWNSINSSLKMSKDIKTFKAILYTYSKFILSSLLGSVYNMGHSNMCLVVLSLSQNSHLVLISIFL